MLNQRNQINLFMLLGFSIIVIIAIITFGKTITPATNASNNNIDSTEYITYPSLFNENEKSNQINSYSFNELDKAFLKFKNLDQATFCIGEEYVLKWESNKIHKVVLKLNRNDSSYYISSNLINNNGENEYVWKVEKPSDKEIYYLTISSLSDTYPLWDQYKIQIKECP